AQSCPAEAAGQSAPFGLATRVAECASRRAGDPSCHELVPTRTHRPPVVVVGSGYRILGIDPGSRVTGYGVVEVGAGGSCYVGSGCIRPRAGPFVDRLGEIYLGVEALIREF